VGVVNVTSHWFRSNQYGTAMGAMSINYQFGGAVGALFAGFLLSIGFGWRALFFIPALVLLVVGLITRRIIVNSPIDVGYTIPATEGTSKDVDDSHLSWLSRFRLILQDRNFAVMCLLSVILTFLRECFTIWMPAYFLDMGARASTAAFKSAIFPLLGCVGTLFAGWFSDRYLNGRRAPVIAVLMIGLVVALFSLGKIEELSAALNIGKGALALGLVGCAGFLLFGPYSLVGGVAALDFGGPRTSGTAIGLLDGAGHLGAVLAGYGVAMVVVNNGWEQAFQLMAIVSVVGIFLTAFLWRVRPKP
jgi:sugar phosphate permease